MNVFTLYTPERAPQLRLWIQSWRSNGYTPRLLTQREVESTKLATAVRRRGGGIFVAPGVFNVCHRRGKFRTVRYGRRGWQRAAVLFFPPNTPEPEILKCLETDR